MSKKDVRLNDDALILAEEIGRKDEQIKQLSRRLDLESNKVRNLRWK